MGAQFSGCFGVAERNSFQESLLTYASNFEDSGDPGIVDSEPFAYELYTVLLSVVSQSA